MVEYLLCPCLLSEGSVLATPEAAEDVQFEPVCCGVPAAQNYDN